MYLQFETKADFIRWAQENILTPQEVAQMLGCSLQAVGQSVRNGKLKVLKKQERITLFLREDVTARAEKLNELRVKYRSHENTR
ncbi:helix-turn-helix domain-containing protein [Alicyclobacillus sendaiensis]|uniref:helix-turn-helix domain-containing protein n=1 Tax=Alicyclobacillus sendaiensis TaxID=192387 RepID=UPI00350E537D